MGTHIQSLTCLYLGEAEGREIMPPLVFFTETPSCFQIPMALYFFHETFPNLAPFSFIALVTP